MTENGERLPTFPSGATGYQVRICRIPQRMVARVVKCLFLRSKLSIVLEAVADDGDQNGIDRALECLVG